MDDHKSDFHEQSALRAATTVVNGTDGEIQAGTPAYADLHAVRHSLVTYGGLVATDRPDLHDLDTDRDKNTVWEIDTQNEVAMVDEAIAVRDALLAALEKIKGGSFPNASTLALSGDWKGYTEALQEIARAAIVKAKDTA